MSLDEEEYRRVLCNMSLGHTAYNIWAAQARRERRYNIARLFEAFSSVKRVRAEVAFRALGEVGTTPTNIERAMAGLEPEAIATGPVTGTNPFARELLDRAAKAMGEGRDLYADELPDLYVCGSCGKLMEGQPPAVCAHCGTVREGFLSFRAAEAMGILGPQSIMKKLEHTSATLHALTEGLGNDLLIYPVNGYSLKELIGHLTDMDVVFRERAWLILETDNPRLPEAHPPTISKAVTCRGQTISDLLDAFQTSRQATLSLLRGLTLAAWHRTAQHKVFGTIPLTHQGNWAVAHERGHLIEMAQIRHDLLQRSNSSQEISLPEQLVSEVLGGE